MGGSTGAELGIAGGADDGTGGPDDVTGGTEEEGAGGVVWLWPAAASAATVASAAARIEGNGILRVNLLQFVRRP